MKTILSMTFMMLAVSAKAAPIIQGTDLVAAINISGKAIASSTLTVAGSGAQIRVSSWTQDGVWAMWGDQTGTVLTTTTASKYGEAVWAKSVSGEAVISTGCVVILQQGTDSTLGQEVLVFSSTNSGNSFGMMGVTLDNCTAGAWCRVGFRGLFPAMVLSSVNKGDELAVSATRCNAQSSTVSNIGAVALKTSVTTGNLVPIFFFH